MNATVAAPFAAPLPTDEAIRAAARRLYRENRRPHFEMVVDVDQTDRCADRLHEEGDASLYHRPTVVWPTSAARLWSECLTVAEFRHWETLGLARIRVEADSDAHANDDDFEDRAPAFREHIAAMEGYGTIGQYRYAPSESLGYWDEENETEGWEDGDSCWGHLGYDDPADPFENGYALDHMRAVNKILRDHFAAETHFGEGI